MTPEEIQANLPPEFKEYADTQVIVDCTELRCQTPSSLVLQSEVYSHYKSHCTFKAMIGMAPHGPLTFVSALYGGSISDRELFRLSGIIPLLSPDMAVMVDKGFRVDNLMAGKLHRPAFRSNKEQMAARDVLETQSIARLRVHVERLIRRGPFHSASVRRRTGQGIGQGSPLKGKALPGSLSERRLWRHRAKRLVRDVTAVSRGVAVNPAYTEGYYLQVMKKYLVPKASRADTIQWKSAICVFTWMVPLLRFHSSVWLLFK
ncbi:hypothetical protein N1851_031663 [Merluccius polli]|uniref:DDE Tnp4 domain-containing protein n=1 Tax=Merluccius polli TaxID=89951 RepID=A0AA47M3F6_MERPO|nr:hypothetical protein N1851_031663 [Merluccius polli]